MKNYKFSRGPNNFVTNADRKVEEVIEELENRKKFSILTEESSFIRNKDKEKFLDNRSIDGTTNF